MSGSREAPPTAPPALLGWGLLTALVLYTVVVFYGVGVPAEGIARHWYEPRAFLFDIPGIASLLDSTLVALVVLGAPALLLAVGAVVAGRSAIAAGVAASCVLATVLFVFYGVQATQVWEFFGWRGSAVLWLLAVFLGFTIAAPLLAGSWLRRSWPLRLALYLPPAFLVIAFVRNATGTDPALKYSISPWPAIPVFGLEIAALLLLGWLFGAAIGLAALSAAVARSGGVRSGALGIGAGIGLVAPAALLLAAGALGLLPFRVTWWLVLPLSLLAAATVALAGTLGRGEAALGQRARRVAVGAVLVGIPLFSGQALARWDYHVTRERQARDIIDALQVYYEREQLYPDSLEELVETGDLGDVPTPAIGFSFLYDGSFRYESFGTSFLLEFPAPRWVECAYTPPYEDEDEYEDEEEDGLDVAAGGAAPDSDDSLDEAWSCPSKPPELW